SCAPARSTLFPYTTLFRSESQRAAFEAVMEDWGKYGVGHDSALNPQEAAAATDRRGYDPWEGHPARAGAEPGASSPVAPGSGTEDRKSTRLNSSHVKSSSA